MVMDLYALNLGSKSLSEYMFFFPLHFSLLSALTITRLPLLLLGCLILDCLPLHAEGRGNSGCAVSMILSQGMKVPGTSVCPVGLEVGKGSKIRSLKTFLLLLKDSNIFLSYPFSPDLILPECDSQGWGPAIPPEMVTEGSGS